ncbi:RNA polymerase sigma factor [Sphingomonas sp. CD22]|uniref:RNA polymerase sigma factor n=1 Tax=Sphingomonas sp. CD22 TaxID=3100214 RepID=UPI002ADF4CF1|nr:RNA polymerase sigma factor [Sphingomonas sp. CD22]MEA1086344.1 RNA polymerase sigma factor [Sphingomonas sp. CD22]
MPAETGLAGLYVEHRAALLRFLIARTGAPAEAEDILQELWLRIATAPSGPVANGRAYLYRMAQNLVVDRIRERSRRTARETAWADIALDQRTDGPEPQQAGSDDLLIAVQDSARLASAITQLPAGAGRAFRLHKIDGLSHLETAAQLGISRKGVEKHVAVAMAHLRRLLTVTDRDALG